MMTERKDIVIVGTGNAGFSAARAAREQSPAASVALIGEEDRAPFNRTRFSKVISCGFQRDEFQIEPPEWYPENRIDLILDRQAVDIDVNGHLLTLASGDAIAWGRLVLATGARPQWPRVVPADLPRVHVIRSARSAEALVAAAESAHRILVAGVGPLGVELAEQFVQMGKTVTLAGDASQVMPKQLNSAAAAVLRTGLGDAGVKLLLNERVQALALAGDGDGALRATFKASADAFDLAVFCVGVSPCVELARRAGLDVGTGVRVDPRQRTSHADIYAAGDVAENPMGLVTGLWRAAGYQGAIAGANAAGADRVNDGRLFRLATTVFGHYYFSVGRPPAEELSGYRVVERQVGSIYQCFYFRDGGLRGAVMMDDHARWQQYQQAIWDAWPDDRVLATLDAPSTAP
jgi:NAD(P)H-nitrite reductase large subunit